MRKLWMSTELNDLLRYHRIELPSFEPVEIAYFDGLKALLVHNQLAGSTDTLDRTGYRAPVREFQRAKGLSPSGVLDEPTLWALQLEWACKRKLTDERVPADVVPGVKGMDGFRLRQDIVPRYQALRDEVHAAGGVITSAGSFRALDATVTPGRSRTSMHYSGLALDLSTVSGMQDPKRDPYIVTKDGARWRVYCRSEQGEERTLAAVKYANKSVRIENVTARVIDLTELMQRHGFAPIGPRSTFPAEYMAAEWWHFQCEAALVPFLSQFGTELLSLARYSPAGLQPHTDVWGARMRIFKRRRKGWM